MAFNIFTLFAKLGIDTKEYDEGLTKAEDSGKSFGSTLSSGFRTALGIGAAAVGAVTTATVAGTKAFVDGVSNVAQYGDRIDKLSQKMNLSAESFQEWDFIMQHAGTSIESMQASIKTLSSAAETGKEAFETLGITQEQLAEMSGEELFEATITALQNVENETQRTYLAGQLLGRGATELGALLNMSAEETEEMRNQVHELGGVLSDDAVKDAAQFQDSLQNMQTSFTGLKNGMLTEFLPSFSTVMDGLSMVFSGDSDSGLSLIEEGVSGMTDRLAEMAPEIISIGGSIITSLISSISSNAPALLESGAEVINEIGLGLVENLPVILPAIFGLVKTVGSSILDNADVLLDAGVDIIMFLVEGIADNSEDIAPAIVSLAHTIISTLTTPEVLIPLLNGGLEIISGLASGLAQAAPELTAMIPEIIANLTISLINVAPQLGDTIMSLLQSLGLLILGAVGGLMGMSYDEVLDAFNNLDGAFVDFIALIMTDLDGMVSDIFSDIGSFFTNLWSDVSGGLGDIIGEVGDFGADVIDSFFSTFEDAKNIVSDAIDDLLGFLDFDWSLPQIKLPHFSVSGGEAPWGFAGQGSFPKVSVQWYAKAMDTPYLLDSATIFGYAGNRAMGGGEAGDEMIYGRAALMEDIAAVVDARLNNLQFIINNYIGNKKIDQQVVSATARANVISGGR